MRNEIITVVCLIAMLVSVNYSMDALNWLRARNGIAIDGDAGVSERVSRGQPAASPTICEEKKSQMELTHGAESPITAAHIKDICELASVCPEIKNQIDEKYPGYLKLCSKSNCMSALEFVVTNYGENSKPDRKLNIIDDINERCDYFDNCPELRDWIEGLPDYKKDDDILLPLCQNRKCMIDFSVPSNQELTHENCTLWSECNGVYDIWKTNKNIPFPSVFEDVKKEFDEKC